VNRIRPEARPGNSPASLGSGPITLECESVPYTPNTQLILQGLASLKPETVAAMHGSCFSGDCSQALLDLGMVMKELLSKPFYNFG
jgi:hypothetical protein